MDVERIVIFVIFGISMLMIPVWLVLEARKNAREREELERRVYLEETESDEIHPDVESGEYTGESDDGGE